MAKQALTKERIPALDPKEVPEVAEYMVAQQELEEFIDDMRKRNPGMLETLSELADRRNTVLEAAQKAVRARQAPCGPFEVHQVSTIYDPVALYDLMGEERFKELGGSIETKRELKLDGKRFDAAVSFRKIPADVVEKVRHKRVAFKDISKIWTL